MVLPEKRSEEKIHSKSSECGCKSHKLTTASQWTCSGVNLDLSYTENKEKNSKGWQQKNKTENGSVSKRQQKFHKIWWGRFVTFVQSTWLLPQSYPKLPTFSKVPQSSPKFPKALEKFPKATLNSQNLPKVTQSFRKFLKVTRNSPKASLSYSRLP